jgi:translation elongation factor EF-4
LPVVVVVLNTLVLVVVEQVDTVQVLAHRAAARRQSQRCLWRLELLIPSPLVLVVLEV